MFIGASTASALGMTARLPYNVCMRESSGPVIEEATDTDRCAARRELIEAIRIEKASLQIHIRAEIEALAGEVLNLREDKIRLEEELEIAGTLADRDTLCPIFNRRAFERELTREIALAERYGTPLCLIFIDLDRFKLVNDRFGHATGDKVIQHIAQTLLDHVRQSDIVGRLGGDEFGIALTHADYAAGRAKAEKLEGIIGSLSVRDADNEALEPVQLGASCGAVLWQRGRDADGLIAEADETMFRRKNEKKRSS